MSDAEGETGPDEKVAELGSIAEGHVARPAAIRRLQALLVDPEGAVRTHAARATVEYLDDPDLAARVLELAGGDPVSGARAAALGALGAVLRAGDLAGAREPVYQPEPAAGEPARELVQRALALLRQALSGTDPGLRRAALPGLCSWEPTRPEVVRAVGALWAEGDLVARGEALLCMGRSGDAVRWGPRIEEGLRASEPEVRLAAVEAAAAARVTSALPRLLALLGSRGEPEPLRAAAAAALAAFGRRGAPALLGAAEEDPSADVRDAARAALAVLE